LTSTLDADISGSPLGLRAARDQQVPVAEKARARRRAGVEAAVPKEILLEALPDDASLIETWLTEIKGQRVRVLVPQRGERRDYLALVKQNAEQDLRAFLVHQEATESASASALTDLAAALDLPGPPHRIECYDISHIQGTNSVASMVVFIEGRPKKSDYRHFTLQAVQGPDDFASMQETLRRRLRYLRQDADRPPLADGDAATAAMEAQARKRERFHEKPDLLLIDGGKGQLGAVVEVLHEMDMWGIPVAGLAKEHEWLYLPEQSEPIVLAHNAPAKHLVMRIRDEAHRFAIGHHRNKRGKAMTKSVLDTLDGVGPVRKKRLMTVFGSVGAIRRASVDEIAAVKGMTPALASRVKDAVTATGTTPPRTPSDALLGG
jgi:excinuclease ABC subunit C